MSLPTERPKARTFSLTNPTALYCDVSKDIVRNAVELVYSDGNACLLGYITGITAIIGVVIAYIQADSADAPVKSHYIFQIRTFVIGFIYFLVGLLLLNIAVGALIILWALVWSLIRNVKGLLALNRNDPIANPESWMFGD
jgi:uncharacterized membrane protein